MARDIRVGGGVRTDASGITGAAYVFLQAGGLVPVHQHWPGNNVDLHLRLQPSFTAHLTERTERIASRLERHFEQRTVAAVERLTRTLATRSQRVETISVSPERVTEATARQPGAATPLVVLRRPAEAARATERPDSAVTQSRTLPQPAHQVDVAKLTEQVMSTMDRRFMAMRERMGRI